MIHTKIQGHRPSGSREEDLFSFLLYMDMAAILVMWTWPFEQTFVPPSHRSSKWNLNLIIVQWFPEEKMFKEGGRQRTMEAYLSYKLTKWDFGSGELKNHNDASFPLNEWSFLCTISWNMVANVMLYNKAVRGQSPQELYKGCLMLKESWNRHKDCHKEQTNLSESTDNATSTDDSLYIDYW